jgi:hypothetical protein
VEPIPAQKSTAVYRTVRLSDQCDSIQLAKVRMYYKVQSTKRLPPLRFLMGPKGWKPLGHVPPPGLVTLWRCGWELTDRRRCRPEIALAYFGPVKKHEAGRRFGADVEVTQAVTPFYKHWTPIQALFISVRLDEYVKLVGATCHPRTA